MRFGERYTRTLLVPSELNQSKGTTTILSLSMRSQVAMSQYRMCNIVPEFPLVFLQFVAKIARFPKILVCDSAGEMLSATMNGTLLFTSFHFT